MTSQAGQMTNPPGSENGAASTCSLISFRLDEQVFVLPIEPIVQIVPMVSIIPLPQVNGAVLGVINVRGVPMPVLDLRLHLGLSKTTLRMYTPIILTLIRGWGIGLVVDEVIDVLNLPVERIMKLSDFIPRSIGEAPILKGLAQMNQDKLHGGAGAMLPLLDPEQILPPEQMHALKRVMEDLPEKMAL